MAKRKKPSASKKTERKLVLMKQQLEVLGSVVPIIRADTMQQRPIQLLGTGFFVATGTPQSASLVVTAKHVLSGHLTGTDEAYCVIRLGLEPDYPNYCFYERDVFYSKTTDLAAFWWPRPPSRAPLPLVRNRISTSGDVVMVEFTQTRVTGSGTEFRFVMHKGNVMCYYLSDHPLIEKTPALDTSFPAFKGASGAPVIALYPGGPVVGLIVGDIERQLLEEDSIRVGHAIAAEAIIEFLTSLGLKPQMI